MLQALLVSQVLLWVVFIGLGLALLALARQIGVLHERVAPLGALMTQSRAEIGEAAPQFELTDLGGRKVQLGGDRDGSRSQLLLFVAPGCPVCKKLLGFARSFAHAERPRLDLVLVGDGDRHEHEALVREHGLEKLPLVISPAVGMSYGIGKLPYAILIDSAGILRSKGLVNSREHLESLVTAFETGFTSIQAYLDSRRAVASPGPPRLN